MDFGSIILWGGLVPALLVFVGLLLAWRVALRGRAIGAEDAAPPCPRCGRDRAGFGAGERCPACRALAPARVRRHSPHWALPILLGAAFAPAFLSLHGSIELWPVETAKRFAHVGFVAALIGVVEALVRLPIVIVAVLRLGAFGFAAWALLEGLRASERFDEAGLWLAVGLASVTGLLASLLIDAASRRLALLVAAGSLVVGAGIISGILMELAHYADGARLTGTLVAMLGAIAVASVVCRGVRLDRGGSVVLVALLMSLLVAGRWLGGIWGADGFIPGLPWPSLLVLMAAPGAVAAVRLPPVARRGLAARTAVVLGAVAIATGAGGLSAWLLSPDPPEVEDPYADFYQDP